MLQGPFTCNTPAPGVITSYHSSKIQWILRVSRQFVNEESVIVRWIGETSIRGMTGSQAFLVKGSPGVRHDTTCKCACGSLLWSQESSVLKLFSTKNKESQPCESHLWCSSTPTMQLLIILTLYTSKIILDCWLSVSSDNELFDLLHPVLKLLNLIFNIMSLKWNVVTYFN